MSYLDKVRRCNTRDLSRYRPFLIDEVAFGFVTPERAKVLAQFPKVFTVGQSQVTFSPALEQPEARTEALAEIAPALTASGLFLPTMGEHYGVKHYWHDAAKLLIDRSLVPGFGFRAFGVHVNGYVRKANQLFLWIGTRAMDRRVEPGKLDNMVAGGQPARLSLIENLIKECDEEASLSAEIAGQARPVSQISYSFDAPEGLKVDSLFCYDLELPQGVTPQNRDGEITGFELHPIEQVLALIATSDRFKFNVNLVIIDFAVRHGAIDPDQEKDFDKIIAGLHERPQ